MNRLFRATRRTGAVVTLALLVLFVFVLVGVFAPWLAPVDPLLQNLPNRLQPPGSANHVLGTDLLGRDVLSRLIAGSRITMIVAFTVVGFAGVFGVAIGMVSGYFGGLIDSVAMRATDVWLAFPFLLFAIALVAVLGGGLNRMILALVLAGWVTFARPVRGEVLSLREREYVLSARSLGASHARVILRHILPNVMPTILVLGALNLGGIIIAEASLSFLGLGVAAGQPTWGGMLADGRAYITRAWWLAMLPGIAIFALVLSVNVVGDWIRDVTDPRSVQRHKRVIDAHTLTGTATGDDNPSRPALTEHEAEGTQI